MENRQEAIDLVKIAKELWQDRRTIIKWGCVGFVAAMVIAFSIPREYSSYVQFVTESKAESSLSSAVGMAAMMGINIDNTPTSGINEKLYPDILRSSPFINEFKDMTFTIDGNNISLYEYIGSLKRPWWSCILALPYTVIGWFSGPYKDGMAQPDPFRPSHSQRNFEATLARRTSIVSDTKSGGITLNVKMQDPEVAAILADSMMVKLEQYMVEYHTHKVRNDLTKSQKILEQARDDYYAAETAYAEAADQNRHIDKQTARIKLDRLANESSLAFSIYQQVAMQVELTKMKLQEETPIATVIEPARVPLSPSEPNKKIIIAALTLLAAAARAGVVVFRSIRE